MCVVLYGNVDAQIRPNRRGKIFPHIPKRYQGGGMLMPRPFYSRSPLKRLGQRADNLQRELWSNLVKAFDGTEQWVNVDDFSRMYAELLDRLLAMGVDPVVCSCVFIDESLFPGSSRQYELFNDEISRLANERGLGYVDFFERFGAEVGRSGWDAVYNKDHFHPNGEGYRLMAKAISDALVGFQPVAVAGFADYSDETDGIRRI